MREQRIRVVVEQPAVVDRRQPMVRVGVVHDLDHAVPIRLLLLRHEVVLVGQRPPHVAKRGQPADDVPQVAVVGLVRHAVEAPVAFVVGMQQNDVGLDAQVAELRDPLFEMLEERRIEPREIPLVGRRALERIERRLVLVPRVPLREHAHAQLVERRRGQRLERLLLQRVALVTSTRSTSCRAA